MSNKERAPPIIVLCDIVGTLGMALSNELANLKKECAENIKCYLASSIAINKLENTAIRKDMYGETRVYRKTGVENIFEPTAFIEGYFIDVHTGAKMLEQPEILEGSYSFKLRSESYVAIADFFKIPVENILLIDDEDTARNQAVKAGASAFDPNGNLSLLPDLIKSIQDKKAVFDQNKIDMSPSPSSNDGKKHWWQLWF